VHNIELFFEVAWFNCDVEDLVDALGSVLEVDPKCIISNCSSK